jgi:triacylglycerol lipase
MLRWLLVALLLPLPALAQPPPDIAAELARIGRIVEVPRTAALYVPLHPLTVPAGTRIRRDVEYGPDPRNRLDVFGGDGAGSPRRVLVFIHGGGFTGGGRRLAVSDRFYDNIMLWTVREGMVGVNMGYRVAPAHPYPAAQEDVAAALAWVARNIAAHGGDPSQVFLMGHSAGAVHAALYAAEPRFYPPGVAPPRGYVFVSGLFAFGAGAGDGSGERAYFGEDEAVRRSRSVAEGLARNEAPMLFAFAELNPPRFNEQAAHAIRVLREAGRAPVVVPLGGHNHLSEIFSIGTDDASLTGPLAAFLRR